jgi:hypothetical protein
MVASHEECISVTYSNFVSRMLLALYQETASGEQPLIAYADLMSKYGFVANEAWLIRLSEDWEQDGLAKVVRGGPADDWQVEITGRGMREIERIHGGDVATREILKPVEIAESDEHFPPGVTEVTGGRTFLTPDPDWKPSDPQPGDMVLSYGEEPLLPASDRLVPLDHNSAPYLQVRDGLAELHEEIRSANDLDCAPEERERVLKSLDAAQRLWDAAQLKVIQIKVGIIITIQDAIELLSKAGKAVGKALLIDAVKNIVKLKTGIDL